MVDRGRQPRLTQKARPERLIVAVLRRQNLQRDLATQARVGRARHAAATKDRLDPVVPDLSAARWAVFCRQRRSSGRPNPTLIRTYTAVQRSPRAPNASQSPSRLDGAAPPAPARCRNARRASVSARALDTPARDEDQASADAQPGHSALLHPWDAAVTLPLLLSMRQCDRALGGLARFHCCPAVWSWPSLVMPPAGCRSAAGRDFIGA